MTKRFLYALLMPLVLILAVWVIIVWSKHAMHLTQDFLFTLSENCSSDTYSVQHQMLVRQKNKKTSPLCAHSSQPIIYRYDATRKQPQEISFVEAKRLRLNADKVSQEGFSVTTGRSISDFYGPTDFFYDHNNDSNHYYLSWHKMRDRLVLSNGKTTYSNFNFLGWVLP